MMIRSTNGLKQKINSHVHEMLEFLLKEASSGSGSLQANTMGASFAQVVLGFSALEGPCTVPTYCSLSFPNLVGFHLNSAQKAHLGDSRTYNHLIKHLLG